jgi:hypothetical protein
MEAPRPARPVVQQHLRRFVQLRPVREDPRRLVAEEGMGLDREDVQSPARRLLASPKVQQSGDVQAGAEAQLADHEIPPLGEALGQPAAGQKHRPRLGQPIDAGEVDVAVQAGLRQAVFAPDQRRAVERSFGGGGGVHGGLQRLLGASVKVAIRTPISPANAGAQIQLERRT